MIEVPDKSYFTLGPFTVENIPSGRTVSSAKCFVNATYGGANTWTKAATVTQSGTTVYLTFAITPTETDTCTVDTKYVFGIKLFYDNSTYESPLIAHEDFYVRAGGYTGSS